MLKTKSIPARMEFVTVESDVKHADRANPQDPPQLASVDSAAIDDSDRPTTLEGRPREPTKRFTWSPEMRDIFQQLVDNQQEMVKFSSKAMYVTSIR